MDWEFVWALIVIPFKFLGKILKNKLGVFAVIVIVVVIIISNMNTAPKNSAQSKPYNQSIPTIAQAPTVVQTQSRFYYVKDYTDDGKVLTLTNFYSYDKDRWVKNKIPLPIDRGTIPVRILPRGD